MKSGIIRIIAGQFRSRRIEVLAEPNLRPTPDRVRETLFNWLTPYIQGAHCLDLFAGTGILGFEALSRGASSVTFVDESRAAVNAIAAQLNVFACTNTAVYQAAIPQNMPALKQHFDIVFIDPPYLAGLLFPTCEYLETQQLLAADAYIYLEANKLIATEELPANWHILKAKKAGQVYFHLAKRDKANV